MSGGICPLEFEQRRCELVEFGAAFGIEHRLPGIEQHFRLEHEAVADDADVGAIAENFAQPAEEVGAVARQFLHALRQRDIEALAEIGDAGLRFPAAPLGRVERVFQRRKLAAQRADLLVERVRLRTARALKSAFRIRARWRPRSGAPAPRLRRRRNLRPRRAAGRVRFPRR